MTDKILLVDDEPNVLDAIKRQLRKQFSIATASSGEDGLRMLEEEGPFAVIISDMQMPGMFGAEFLARVRKKNPDSVRMMLTGHAELDSAITAVNEGNIFRFLTKPCPPDVLAKAVQAGLEQYKLVVAERDLLEKTLSSSIKVLTEILSLVNPEAFSSATRVQRYVEEIAGNLGVPRRWQFRLSAMLSQIGCVSLPTDTLRKVYAGQELSAEEQQMFHSHPEVAGKLLRRIPRLETVAQIITDQMKQLDPSLLMKAPKDWELVVQGAQILRAAVEFDRLLVQGMPRIEVLQIMQQSSKSFPEAIIKALHEVKVAETQMESKTVKVSELRTRMILDEDVKADTGLLLVGRGQVVTQAILARLQNFAQGVGVVEPFRVFVPR